MSFRPAARQFFARRGAPAPPLPYDYAVEYIETDGVASYIDTGVQPDWLNSKIRLTFRYVSWNTSFTITGANTVCGAAYGSTNSSTAFRIGSYIAYNEFRLHYPTADGAELDTENHDVEMAYDHVTWDGIPLTLGSFSASPTPGQFCLGSRGSIATISSPQRWFSNARFYSCKIYTNNALVFDGIPVIANGVAGLYDSISGTVKTNAAATGTITAGPRV